MATALAIPGLSILGLATVALSMLLPTATRAQSYINTNPNVTVDLSVLDDAQTPTSAPTQRLQPLPAPSPALQPLPTPAAPLQFSQPRRNGLLPPPAEAPRSRLHRDAIAALAPGLSISRDPAVVAGLQRRPRGPDVTPVAPPPVPQQRVRTTPLAVPPPPRPPAATRASSPPTTTAAVAPVEPPPPAPRAAAPRQPAAAAAPTPRVVAAPPPPAPRQDASTTTARASPPPAAAPAPPSPPEPPRAANTTRPTPPAAPAATANGTAVAAAQSTTPARPPAPPQTASLGPSSPPGDIQVRVSFEPESAKLLDNASVPLDSLAERLGADTESRVQLLAYAAGSPENSSQARRLSLSRALAVRSFLIEKGVRSTRMDVRALGNKVGDGPADRVDIRLVQP